MTTSGSLSKAPVTSTWSLAPIPETGATPADELPELELLGVVAVLDPLLPQPASARPASSGIATRTRRLVVVVIGVVLRSVWWLAGWGDGVDDVDDEHQRVAALDGPVRASLGPVGLAGRDDQQDAAAHGLADQPVGQARDHPGHRGADHRAAAP